MALTRLSGNRSKVVLIAAAGCLIAAIFGCYKAGAFLNAPFGPMFSETIPKITEGPVTEAVVTAGPFDIHRKYRSMEGPFVNLDIKIADLLASKTVDCPEGMVNFSEGGATVPGMTRAKVEAPKMMGAHPDSANYETPQGVVKGPDKPEMYWLKGIKLEVLDENNKVMPTAEFICHWNIDIDPDIHNMMFADAHPVTNTRLDSISQGETAQFFPTGYGFPVATNEIWHLSFQAANRTTTEHRR
ncbi:MAG: hypothetical protein ACRD3W_27020, partial [Terriglobales bacterium]